MLTFRWNFDGKTLARFPRLSLVVSTQMKIFPITLIFILFFIPNVHAKDERISLFVEAQKIFFDYELKEAEVIINSFPETKLFYKLWIKMKEDEQEMDLIAFKWRIANDPNSINWENPWEWTIPLKSSDDALILSEIFPDYRVAREEFLKSRSAVQENTKLFKLRNSAYKNKRDAIEDLEKKLTEDIELLQAKVKHKILG